MGRVHNLVFLTYLIDSKSSISQKRRGRKRSGGGEQQEKEEGEEEKELSKCVTEIY